MSGISHWMPHGMCFGWDPAILWVRVAADCITACSYFTITATLVQIIDGPLFRRFSAVILMFALFILLCGLSHVFDVVTVWVAAYIGDAIVRALTAVVSLATALGLLRVWPSLRNMKAGGEDGTRE